MPDLLLELFSEEIPARMQKGAEEHLCKCLKDTFPQNTVKGFSTPRRVAAIVSDLPKMQPDVSLELKGPKLGAPEAALQGFLKKNNLTQADLQEVDGVYMARIERKGQPTADVLKEIIEKTLREFPWPKSMRWSDGETAWVRPKHNILCIFDSKVVPVEFAGITANSKTFGHRFLSPGEINVTDAGRYESALEKAHVIADREARKANILAQAQTAAKKAGLTLKEDAGLLEEVTGLVEWPVVLVGKIDAAFMDLPPEVLISEMRAHQKYFALLNADGTMSDKFLITANMETNDSGKLIIAGNERVLRARLSDGRFFWDQDRKVKLADWAKKLEQVTYHAKLGSIAEKVERVKTLAAMLTEFVPGADKTKVEQAATLCKADLVTGMVGEFPELQGVMGRYYAIHEKLPQEVADAIRDHYKPLGPSDAVPTQGVSICVALADKLDTLIGMFGIGEKPTGSKDPFALRRAALGVIRIVLENNLRLPLKRSVNDELLAFFHDRLKVQLKDQGIRHDIISAGVMGDDDLLRIVSRAKALQNFLGTEDGTNLLAGYKRASNILAAEEKKDKTTYDAAALKSDALKDAEEKALAAALKQLQANVEPLLAKEDFAGVMRSLANLRAPIDAFFEKTLVNCEDKALRAERLKLLAAVKAEMHRVADFAQIEG